MAIKITEMFATGLASGRRVIGNKYRTTRRLWEIKRELEVQGNREDLPLIRSFDRDLCEHARVLVISPHPDDESIGCGGTLALLTDSGSEVDVVFLTSGASPKAVHREKIREQEARCAGEILGISHLYFLKGWDGKLHLQDWLAERLSQIIQSSEYDLIFCPWLEDRHNDHMAAFRILRNAIPASSGRVEFWFYEVWTCLSANRLVAIDASMRRKIRAIRAHQSQIRDTNFVAIARALARYRAKNYPRPGVQFAEAFYACNLAELARLSDAYRREDSVGVPCARANLATARQPTGSHRLRIAVGIATTGRAQLLRDTFAELDKQIRLPDHVFVCGASVADLPCISSAEYQFDLIVGRRGSSHQRNEIIRCADFYDILAFFDDDFFPDAAYLREIEKIFENNRDIVLVTGQLIADGIIGPGLTVEEARDKLAGHRNNCAAHTMWEVPSGYGCNMAIRMAPVRANGLLFDENLPLYAWLEDVDFGYRLSRHGRVIKSSAALGVHLGIKQGRQPGRRLGYSQIANPIYLARKGTLPWRLALLQASRNLSANCIRALKPEPYIDRSGRLAGNARGLRDFIAGRLDPRRVLEL